MSNRKKWVSFFYRLQFVILLLLVPIIANADDPGDLPCDGTDPYTPCPLDTWVIVLAIGAFIFTVIHLYRKQKSLQA